ncbi:Alpha/beta hydrolase fold-1 [Chaetomium fimeti]|uniref:Alpha/beta hydrolase fold-1 n=1 Tax=Chaetomium fimeti TaxID=1854472 RepID=A0AAE0H6U3_9PEZI|nr:Alpha/beta hydrolase fold-1 [Chaetomium fimeti]
MPHPSDLAVVLCHGSYHTPAPYGALLEALQVRGIAAYCPQLPTADLAKLNVGDVANPDFGREPPPGGYPQGEEDTEAVLSILKPLVEAGTEVLMVGHSSGGWAATQAAQPDLQADVRKSQDLAGGVIGILYAGAFVIPVGESVNSFFQPKDGNFVTPPFMTFHKHGAAGLGTIVDAEKFLFNDLDESTAKQWAATLTASPILTSKLTNDAYSALPCAYLVLEGDLTLPREYQEGMAGLQASKTGNFSIYNCPAGHSPHLSWTEGMVDTIQSFIEKIKVDQRAKEASK